MTPYIQARSKKDLFQQLKEHRQGIRDCITLTPAQRYERIQLEALLRALASSSELKFPFDIFHTSHKGSIDFSLRSLDHSIGLEASRIANEKLERLRRLQQSVVNVSSLLVHSSRKRNGELIQESSTIPQFVFGGNTSEEEISFWCDSAMGIVERKTKILHSTTTSYNECWLLLWDNISANVEETLSNAKRLLPRLLPFWTDQKWFKKIMIQPPDLTSLVVLMEDDLKFIA